MQSVHVLDAVLRTGWVKYSQTKISTLSLKDLPPEAVPFVQAWRRDARWCNVRASFMYRLIRACA